MIVLDQHQAVLSKLVTPKSTNSEQSYFRASRPDDIANSDPKSTAAGLTSLKKERPHFSVQFMDEEAGDEHEMCNLD